MRRCPYEFLHLHELLVINEGGGMLTVDSIRNAVTKHVRVQEDMIMESAPDTTQQEILIIRQ